MSAEQGIQVTTSDFYMVAQAAKRADKDLAANMRREVKGLAQPMVQAIRSEIGRIPSSGRYRTGIRTGLQRGTTVRVLTGSPKTAGLVVQTSAKHLPAEKAALARAFNLAEFTHPVRRSGIRVTQHGRPYFGAVINLYRADLRAGLRKAVDETALAIARAKGRTIP